MNYGRKSTTAKEKELLSKSTMIRKKFTVIFAKMLLVCFVALIVVGGCAGYGIYKGIIDSAPENIDATPTGYLSTVLDIDGNEQQQLNQYKEELAAKDPTSELKDYGIFVPDEKKNSVTDTYCNEVSSIASTLDSLAHTDFFNDFLHQFCIRFFPL